MNLGKKIICPKCKTKLFTFNKVEFPCPICKKNIIVPDKLQENNFDINEELENNQDISDEELLNTVIPQNYYEILDVLNNLDNQDNLSKDDHDDNSNE
jgi:uncharacterized Zn finger protein (UPF0148 family)